MSKWTKNSWENFTVKHIPEYKDKDALKKAGSNFTTQGS